VRHASRCHVAIIGGGPAGLASAIALLREGLAVIVVERTDHNSLRVGEHLPPSAKPLLTSLGIAGLLDNRAHASCPGIRSAWGASEPADKDYLFHPYGEGMNLLRPEFDRDMVGQAVRLGAEIATRTKLLDIRRTAGAWEIALGQDAKRHDMRADFVIDATGRAASLAKRLGARPIVYDDLVGIFARCVGASGKNRSVYIEAQERGWWYSAGLADDSLIATFLSDPDLVDLSQCGRAVTWRKQLEESTITRTRGVAVLESQDLHVRTARTHRLDIVEGDGWLAVGDAAMSFDPLSSEGISKGLEWGMKAARAVAASVAGDMSAAGVYRCDLEKTFSEYLSSRHRYYSAEKRWPDAAFWRRRHERPVPWAQRDI
jgi:flavin-dependent dehydrogenase